MTNIYNKTLPTVLDVTKPPFNAIPDGIHDCTCALTSAIDFVLKQYIDAYNETKDKLSGMQDNALISFEIRKVGNKLNIPFPERLPKAYIIYLPKGVYLVSNTVSYSLENIRNTLQDEPWLEMNAGIRLVGEDKNQTVIKLKDFCTGFEYGARKPVVNFCKGEKSGVAMSNLFENITIDTGSGNAGAVGLRFFSNNSGEVNNVTVRTSDKDLKGYAGFEIIDEKVSCSFIKNLDVTGFDYAVRITPQQHCVAFEHITIKNQRIAGIYHSGSVVSLRDLKSTNSVTAIHTVGFTAHIAVFDSVLSGGDKNQTAFNAEYGFAYLRNVKCDGYKRAIKTYFDCKTVSEMPYEYSSHGAKTLYDNVPDAKLFDTSDMPEPPEFELDESNYALVTDYGAKGDGVTDDTNAIKEALNSGKAGIIFGSGRYLINDVIDIPETVNIIDFMFCDILVGEKLQNNDLSVFRIIGKGSPIKLCNLFTWEKFYGRTVLIDNSSTRTTYLKMLHTQSAAMYKNSVPGGVVFIECCACTVGGIPGAGYRKKLLPFEDKFINTRDIPGFYFKNQTVYARQINAERALCEIINDGGKLTVLGFKTEEEGTAFKTLNGGTTQIMNGICCIGLGKEIPLIENEDSHCFAVLSTMINCPQQTFPIAVKDVKDGEVKIIKDDELPKRAMLSYTLPEYIG